MRQKIIYFLIDSSVIRSRQFYVDTKQIHTTMQASCCHSRIMFSMLDTGNQAVSGVGNVLPVYHRLFITGTSNVLPVYYRLPVLGLSHSLYFQNYILYVRYRQLGCIRCWQRVASLPQALYYRYQQRVASLLYAFCIRYRQFSVLSSSKVLPVFDSTSGNQQLVASSGQVQINTVYLWNQMYSTSSIDL